MCSHYVRVSSTCLNKTMMGYVLHLFTKWPRHIFMERLFSPRQKEVGSSSVTWNGNGEMTYRNLVCLWNAANVINTCSDFASSSFLWRIHTLYKYMTSPRHNEI